MHGTPSSRELYPHREVGLALIILAVLLIILATLLVGYCSPVTYSGPVYPPGPSTTSCEYPYAGGSIFLGLVGFVLLIVGLVLMTQRNPAYAWSSPNAAAWTPYYVPPPPPPAPQIACKGCGRIYPLGQHPFCPNCGSKLGA